MIIVLLACADFAPLSWGGVPSEMTDTQSDASPTDSGTDATCPDDMVAQGGFCIDRFEAPGHRGALPLVMYTLSEAEAWCSHREKRLCFDDEWQDACEGGSVLARAASSIWWAMLRSGRCEGMVEWRASPAGAGAGTGRRVRPVRIAAAAPLTAPMPPGFGAAWIGDSGRWSECGFPVLCSRR